MSTEEPPRIIGLPPREESRPEPTPKDLMGGRLLNGFGLISPVANVAMLQFAPRELRWMGLGAGVLLWAAGGWGMTSGGLHGVCRPGVTVREGRLGGATASAGMGGCG